MNIPRKLHRPQATSTHTPGNSISTSLKDLSALIRNAIKGRGKRKETEESEEGKLEEGARNAFARSLSVPKIGKLAGLSTDSLRGNTTMCGNTVLGKKRDKSRRAGEKGGEGGRKNTANKKNAPGNSAYFTQSLSSQMTLGGSPSKPSFPPTSDLESQLLSSQRAVSKLDFLSLLSLYDRYFTKAIKVSGPLEPVLIRIKAGYEGLIEDLMGRNSRDETKLKQEIEQCDQYREEIKRITEQNNSLEEELMKLRKENEDLRSNYQQLEAKNAVQHRRASILSFPGFPPSLEEYAKLVSDLEGFKEKSETLTKEMTAMKGREQKLTLVVRAVKRRESWGELSVEKKPAKTETEPDLPSQVMYPRRSSAISRIRTQPDPTSDSSDSSISQ